MKRKEQILADKMIKELKEAGYSPDEMIKIFRLARKKFELKTKRR